MNASPSIGDPPVAGREATPARPRLRSLAQELSLALAAMVLIVSLLSAGLVLLQSAHRSHQQLEEKADEQITALAAALEMPLWAYDLDTIRRIGQDFGRNDSAERIRVSGSDGKVLLALDKASGDPGVSRASMVSHNGLSLGKVEISLVPRQQAEASRHFIWSTLGTLAANCLVLLAATGFLLRRFLHRPLERMRSLVASFAEGGPEGTDRSTRYLEFQGLVEVLEAMSGQIAGQLEELQAAERKYRTIFENAIEGVFQSTPEGRYLSANPAMARILGYESPEALIEAVHEISREVYVDPSMREELMRSMLQGRSVSNFEIPLRRRDGSTFWGLVKAHPVFGREGRLVFIEGTLEDITERVQARQSIQDLNAELERRVAARTSELAVEKERAEAANRAKSAFLASMSHELRTPLNAVLGYAQLMQRDPGLDKKQKAQLWTINQSGEHLLGLINDILEISKIEAGCVTMATGPLGVHELLDELRTMFKDRAEAKGLGFGLRVEPSLPRAIVLDGRKLRQILINLLGNAVKFTHQGGVCLAAGLDEAGRLAIDVSDSGPGIADSELDAVFRRFEQTESGRVMGSGTGLGMSISREYARLMGGDITVESQVGQGTVFRVRLPFSAAEPVLVQPCSSPRKVTGLLSGQKPPRLLVVDDEEDNREVLASLLRALGCEVSVASSGQEALAVIGNLRPDLVWMDIRMPGMDGMETTRALKAMEAGRDTKVIALTASAWQEEEAPIRASGCDDIVHKPYRENDVFDTMARHLNLVYEYD